MSNDTRARLAADLRELLTQRLHQDKYELRQALVQRGWPNVTTSAINSVLYSYRAWFRNDDSMPPRWSVTSPSPLPEHVPQTPAIDYRKHYRGNRPRAWQLEAWKAWHAAGRRGVVEAVTGTGKTTVGILCTADAAARGLRTLVVVPGVELLDQWYTTLSRDTQGLQIGRYGDGYRDSLANHHVLVATV